MTGLATTNRHPGSLLEALDHFESSRSIVVDQAENRLHTIKAVLVAALAG